MEEVTINFAKVEYSYQPQGADGKAQGGPILAGWDVKANVKA
jgi:type VI protein secretion system component Hcp